MVGDRSRGLLGVDLGALRRDRVGAVRAGARLAGDAGCGVVPRRAAQLRRARAPAARPTAMSRSATPPSCGRSRELTQGELRDEVARLAGGLRALGVGPGDRVAAYLPNIPEAVVGVPRLRVDRRDLVELLARLRRPERDRPVRADRAEGAARRRRLPLRRQGLRPHARCVKQLLASLPTVEHTVVLGYLDPSPSLAGLGDALALGRAPSPRARARRSRSSRCRSTIRSGCSTARARRACRRRSSTATAGSCSRC